MYLSGQPIANWSSKNVYIGGSDKLRTDPRNLSAAFDTTQFISVLTSPDTCKALDPGKFKSSCADILPTGDNYRTFPANFGRSDSTKNLDLSLAKSFRLWEGTSLQYRFEAFNALNRATFGTPSTDPSQSTFGTITTTANEQRVVQMGLRLSF
jgi:hypothetical protein